MEYFKILLCLLNLIILFAYGNHNKYSIGKETSIISSTINKQISKISEPFNQNGVAGTRLSDPAADPTFIRNKRPKRSLYAKLCLPPAALLLQSYKFITHEQSAVLHFADINVPFTLNVCVKLYESSFFYRGPDEFSKETSASALGLRNIQHGQPAGEIQWNTVTVRAFHDGSYWSISIASQYNTIIQNSWNKIAKNKFVRLEIFTRPQVIWYEGERLHDCTRNFLTSSVQPSLTSSVQPSLGTTTATNNYEDSLTSPLQDRYTTELFIVASNISSTYFTTISYGSDAFGDKDNNPSLSSQLNKISNEPKMSTTDNNASPTNLFIFSSSENMYDRDPNLPLIPPTENPEYSGTVKAEDYSTVEIFVNNSSVSIIQHNSTENYVSLDTFNKFSLIVPDQIFQRVIPSISEATPFSENLANISNAEVTETVDQGTSSTSARFAFNLTTVATTHNLHTVTVKNTSEGE